jgi:hypothetical protein
MYTVQMLGAPLPLITLIRCPTGTPSHSRESGARADDGRSLMAPRWDLRLAGVIRLNERRYRGAQSVPCQRGP